MVSQELAPYRILIVEDQELIARLADSMLMARGCRHVVIAHTVAQALRAMAEDTFHMAVLDLKLQTGTSLPVAEALRKAGVPFVFATAYGAAQMPLAWRDVLTVPKPFDAQQLMIGLLRALDEAGGKSGNRDG